MALTRKVCAGLAERAAEGYRVDADDGPAAVPRPAPRPRAATYRVQLNADFTFDDAAAIAGYLAALGVSHLYCSPYLQAAPGSRHGYDVTNHIRLNRELGGAAGHARLVERLAEVGLGQVLDIVPNHMAQAGRENAWWWDVLENGPASRYASYFDIDWRPRRCGQAATVLMPILGDHYGRVLDAGELAIERSGGSFAVRYYEQQAPLSPRTIAGLLARAATGARSPELADLAAEHAELPPGARGELRASLAGLFQTQPAVAAAVDDELAAVNRDPDALDELLRRQHYRLASWRTAATQLNYRRFFNISTLVGLRAEDEIVFADTHRLILELVRAGQLDGLRVDHVDGLADPAGYLGRLRQASGGSYLIVEKVLAPDEQLPGDWLAAGVAGTTGYDFLNRVGQLYVDPDGAAALRAGYARFTGQRADYADVVRTAKLQIIRDELATETERLTGLLADICEQHRRQRDHHHHVLRDALAEVIAAFPVYRSYPRPGYPASAADREHVATATAAVRQRRPDLDAELIAFIGELALLDDTGPDRAGPPAAEFAVRFAQLSAAVAAKGLEDTAFYRYYPLVALNEVGGDPDRFGRPVAEFHLAMAEAAQRYPEAMLTLATHDTKRSGDVRARISLLAELPQAWEQAMAAWSELNQAHRRGGWPDANAEYLLYQTLVGAWPIGTERACAFMRKAAREARVHTSWTDPSADYEGALDGFVTAVLADDGFVAALTAFLAEHRLVERGRESSLAQTALLLTCPGVPDLYQGTELWELSLVDPDNRRPVDFAARARLLAELAGTGPEAALARADAGAPKLWLIQRALAHRRRHPRGYGPGSGYQPLTVSGTKAAHAIAFTRAGGLAVVVPRLLVRLGGQWADTTVALPDGGWVDVLTGAAVPGGRVRLADLLRRFPVAILGRER
jgi:(1->4)-alpha-D-glucan 1-alpha-D-glucosylmutase